MNRDQYISDATEYVRELSVELEISCPRVVFTKDMSILRYPTTIGVSDLDHGIIYINDIYDYSVNVPFLMYNIAHEVRHFFQWSKALTKEEQDTFFFRPRATESEVAEYLSDAHEIDANEYAKGKIKEKYGVVIDFTEGY